MDFLQLAGKTILVLGVANRKSVAWHVGQVLAEAGAKVVYSVRSAGAESGARQVAARRPRFTFATSNGPRTDRPAAGRGGRCGIRGCMGWCTRSRLPTIRPGPRRFTRRRRQAFLRSVDISCYSLVALAEGP